MWVLDLDIFFNYFCAFEMSWGLTKQNRNGFEMPTMALWLFLTNCIAHIQNESEKTENVCDTSEEIQEPRKAHSIFWWNNFQCWSLTNQWQSNPSNFSEKWDFHNRFCTSNSLSGSTFAACWTRVLTNVWLWSYPFSEIFFSYMRWLLSGEDNLKVCLWTHFNVLYSFMFVMQERKSFWMCLCSKKVRTVLND